MTFTVCKALVADGSTAGSKVETQGILGAAAGCGVILGPVIAMVLVSSQTEAAVAASLVQASVLAVLLFVPFESTDATDTGGDDDAQLPAGDAAAEAAAEAPSAVTAVVDTAQRGVAGRAPTTGVLALGGLTDAAFRAWDELRHATPGEFVLVTARWAHISA
jgi:hypothetical protein